MLAETSGLITMLARLSAELARWILKLRGKVSALAELGGPPSASPASGLPAPCALRRRSPETLDALRIAEPSRHTLLSLVHVMPDICSGSLPAGTRTDTGSWAAVSLFSTHKRYAAQHRWCLKPLRPPAGCRGWGALKGRVGYSLPPGGTALWRRGCADLCACTEMMPEAPQGRLMWRLCPRQAAQYASQLVALWSCTLACWRSKKHERNNL